jgi:GDP-L-fucose synthase
VNLKDKIYLAGHLGLVGSAIYRILIEKGYSNIVVRSRNELDLTSQSEVNNFFANEKPDYVILAAAKVGGIFANNNYPANFIYENLMIQSNVINSAYLNSVKRLLFLGSSCIYPKSVIQPMKEDALLTGALEPTNEPYAVAKISGIKLCESYNRQYGTDFRSVMPTNLYGINDNFDNNNSHVIPALIKRFHDAKVNKDKSVMVWGTGKALREFLYVDDMALGSIFVLGVDKKLYDSHTSPMLSHINIGSGKEVSIRELAELIKDIVCFQGQLDFDDSKPDGAPRKLIDNSRISNLGWEAEIDLSEGISKTYNWLKNHLKDI